MPRMFAVQLKDDAAERYENSVSTPVYTQDFEGCVGWLGDELPDKGHPCEFAGIAGDGAVYCASAIESNSLCDENDRLEDENAKLRELCVDMHKSIGSMRTSFSEFIAFGERMSDLGIEV